MATIDLACGRAGTLFYEPDGLLLRCCLLPADDGHRHHLLTFQLGYLGAGDVTVDVALKDHREGGDQRVTTTRLCGSSYGDEDFEDGERTPSVSLSYLSLSEETVSCGYTVCGRPGARADELRGELVAQVSGRLPELSVDTSVSVTREPPSGSLGEIASGEWDFGSIFPIDGPDWASVPGCPMAPVPQEADSGR